MKFAIDPNYQHIYENGCLDYALSCMAKAESFDNYIEFLKGEPVASFTNDDDWELVDNVITYRTETDTEYKEELEATMVIEMNGEYILHSLQSPSCFFLSEPESKNHKLRMVYVD